MRLIKRAIALICAAAMLLSVLPVSVFAFDDNALVSITTEPNARIVLGGVSLNADQNGFASASVPVGQKSVYVSASGYDPAYLPLNVDCDIDCTVTLKRSESIDIASYVDQSTDGYYDDVKYPSNAFDANYSTGWQAKTQTAGDYIGGIFQSRTSVSSVAIFWEDDARAGKTSSAYTVQYTTDGNNWRNVGGASYEFYPAINNVSLDTVTFNTVSALGLRVVVNDFSSKYAANVYEIRISTTKTPTAKLEITRAYDADSSTVNAVELSSAAAQISTDGQSLRIIAAVSSLLHDFVGFKITVSDPDGATLGEKTYRDNKVFRSIRSAGQTDITSASFSITGGYVFSLIINSLPTDAVFTVTPFIQDGGSVKYADAVKIRLSAGGLSVYSENAEREYIEGEWIQARVPNVNDSGEKISLSTFTPSRSWINATVPGTVLTSYMNAGLIDDPFYGTNMDSLDQDYYNVDYWYRTQFTVPESYDGKRIWLNFDGVNWKARVYVNGKKVGDVDGAFTRGRFDVTDLVHTGDKNFIAVYIVWCNSTTAYMPSFLCSASWDWMPAIPGRNMGIYKPVYLSVTDDVTVCDPYVVTDLPLPDLSSAQTTVSAFVKNASSKNVTGLLTGSIVRTDGSGPIYTVAKEVTVKANSEKNVIFDTFTMYDPDLWWPNGSGEQPLYTLDLQFTVDGVISDKISDRFGVRELSYTYTEGDCTVYVNGRPILCKGGNWGIPDAMLRYTDEDFYDAIRMHKDMNFNMIRTWHGTSDFEAFYDACDEYGIMVFEDFWLNGYFSEFTDDATGYELDKEMFMANVEDKVRRLRNHVCITVWCGENENVPTSPLDEQIPAMIRKYEHERLYTQSSNEAHRDGEPNIFSGGISYQTETPAWYFWQTTWKRGFVTELGATVLPTYESLKRMAPESSLWPVSNYWYELHGWDYGVGNKGIDEYKNAIRNRYGSASNLEKYCEEAQLVNYETFKAMFEAFNDDLFNNTSGLLLWMSHPAWTSDIWQLYDYYKAETGAYFGSKLACEPLHVQFNAYTYEVTAVNTTDQNKNVKVAVDVYNLDGSHPYSQTFTKTAQKLAATSVIDRFEPQSGFSETYFIFLRMFDAQTNELISRNSYWIGSRSSHDRVDYTAMKNMSKATLSSSFTRVDNADGTTTLTVTVNNQSSVPAVAVHLTANKSYLPEGDSDIRILPVFYEDNYFCLMPNESRTLTVTFDTEDLNGTFAALTLKAFNSSKINSTQS